MKKRLFTFLIILLTALPLFAQRPKVGLVLCGGGAKGAAHIGVLKVLEENNIPIDYIAGTSTGAIVGGLYAAGYSAEELDSLTLSQDWTVIMSDALPRRNITIDAKKIDDRLTLKVPFGNHFFRDLSNNRNRSIKDRGDSTRRREEKPPIQFASNPGLPMALIAGQNIYNLFAGLTIGYQDSISFDKLTIPYACVAVDLNNKKEVVFHSGVLAQAMRSSMAIPGVFAPVKIGDMLLVDGGVTNNYPVDVAKEMGADIIIGVKLGEYDEKKESINNVGDVVNALIDMMMEGKYDEGVKNTDIFITPSVLGYNSMSFEEKSLRTLIDNGEKAALDKISEIRDLKEYLDEKEKETDMNLIGPKYVRPQYQKAIRLDQDSIVLASISFKGISEKDGELLLRKCKLKTNEKIPGIEIQKAIELFYATEAYSSVTYSLYGTENPYDMVINFVPSFGNQIGLGVRFDSEEIAALLLDVRLNYLRLYGSKYDFSARASYNYALSAGYSYNNMHSMQFNANYSFRRYDMGLLDNGKQVNNMAFRQSLFDVGFSTRGFKTARIAFGARYTLFDYTSLISETYVPDVYDSNINRDNFLSAYAGITIDGLDDNVFPKKGVYLNVKGSYFFDIFKNNDVPFLTASFKFKSVASIGNRVAMIPFMHCRVVIGDNAPAAYMNVMGGYEFGRYMEQQMPFYGINNAYSFGSYLGVIGTDLRVQIGGNHYLYAGINYGKEANAIKEIFDVDGIWGARLGYSFDMKFGPLSFDLHWSDYTSKVGAYMSFGYWF